MNETVLEINDETPQPTKVIELGKKPETETKTLHELIDEANDAMHKMSVNNPHRRLIYYLAGALSQIATMLETEKIRVARLKDQLERQPKSNLIITDGDR